MIMKEHNTTQKLHRLMHRKKHRAAWKKKLHPKLNLKTLSSFSAKKQTISKLNKPQLTTFISFRVIRARV